MSYLNESLINTLVAKRVFDIFLSALTLTALSPVLAFIALSIKIRMPGPVFFRQERVGFKGRIFRIVKFRTMKPAAYDSNITVAGESRITRLGSVLRKYKLDELPELWNILKGDMSFVGPRPDVPGYADKLTGEERNILQLRPGLTGAASLEFIDEDEVLSQQPDPVKYNNEILYPAKVRLDLQYYYNHSFTGDLKIIFKTILRTLAQSKIV